MNQEPDWMLEVLAAFGVASIGFGIAMAIDWLINIVF